MRRMEEGLGREADVVGEVGPVNFRQAVDFDSSTYRFGEDRSNKFPGTSLVQREPSPLLPKSLSSNARRERHCHNSVHPRHARIAHANSPCERCLEGA